MREQRSFLASEMERVLYLVPTPIGNLEDMTFRAVRILGEVDLIAAEDTRQTRKLLNHFDLNKPLVSYHEHNRKKAGDSLIEQMNEGKAIALVSDAGMPAISDPGQELVAEALKEGIRVIALPGANAALTSLIASGLPTDQFQFIGFLPRQKKQRRESLELLKKNEATLLFYEAPHRLKETLTAMFDVFGNRRVSLGRELTKKYEEYQRGTLSEAIEWCKDGTVRGEFTLVLEGRTEAEIAEDENWWEELSEIEHVEHYIVLGQSPKDAIKTVAQERNIPKREVYAIYHRTDNKKAPKH